MATPSGYITFIVHCPLCHQRLNPSPPDGETTVYSHENQSDCPEGGDIELTTVTVEQFQEVFGRKPAARAKPAAKKASKKKA